MLDSDAPDASSVSGRLAALYDELPYEGRAYYDTHPVRLRTAAMLRGLAAAPEDSCRVLELGCAEGGNIVPVAEAYPTSEFVGIDISRRHVEKATDRVDQLGLNNVDIRRLDILDVDETLGLFDYIVCHGVYSWVPGEAQDKILEIFRTHATPRAVSYVSYNTYPGWHVKDLLRKVMLDRASGLSDLHDRVEAAREAMRWLIDITDTSTTHGAVLQGRAEAVIEESDQMIAHEFLAPINEPVYFEEFVQRLERHGLRYLGEQGGSTDVVPPGEEVGPSSPGSEQDLRSEQYGDIINNTAFRRSVVCRDDEPVDDLIDASGLAGFHVAASLSPDGPVDLQDHSLAVFKGRNATTRVIVPTVKVAIDYVTQLWPGSVSIGELAKEVGHRLADSDESESEIEAALIPAVLNLYTHRSAELSCSPFDFTTEVSERPAVTASARLDARTGTDVVTNRRHETMVLDELLRFLVTHLDGTRTEPQLLAAAEHEVAEGRLTLRGADDSPIRQPREQARALRWLIPQSLDVLAGRAMLIS